MPTFRRFQDNGLLIITAPTEWWRRPKWLWPYYVGNTARVRIRIKRLDQDSPGLWRVRLIRINPEGKSGFFSEPGVLEGSTQMSLEMPQDNYFLSDRGTVKYRIKVNGWEQDIITIDVLPIDQIRFNLFVAIVSSIVTFLIIEAIKYFIGLF